MYAVIKTGGKQYRVEEGQFLNGEKIELETGATIKFDEILLVGEGEKINVGTPFVKGCKVEAVVEDHGRADKIRIIKIKRRKHHMKRMGHRQWFTKIKITKISAAA